MNEQAKTYWNNFWAGQEAPTQVTAEKFGYDEIVDELADLIASGKKKATCGAHALYELENEPLPVAGKYTIVLNSKEEPVAIIKTTEVILIKMNEMTPELAAEEGEGDLSFQYWWDGHVKAFTMFFAEHGLEFSDDILLVFERFELVDVKNSKC